MNKNDIKLHHTGSIAQVKVLRHMMIPNFDIAERWSQKKIEPTLPVSCIKFRTPHLTLEMTVRIIRSSKEIFS